MRQDSNLGPLEYQSSALPTELRMHAKYKNRADFKPTELHMLVRALYQKSPPTSTPLAPG